MTFDLNKAAETLRAEANLEPFGFEWDGITFWMPLSVDIRIPMLLKMGDLRGAFEVLLGPDQWAELSGSPSMFDEYALKALFDQWKEHRGIDLGESLASRDSLANTPNPSRPTSNGNTASPSRISRQESSPGGSFES